MKPKQIHAICDILDQIQTMGFRQSRIQPICKPGCHWCCYEMTQCSQYECVMVLQATMDLNKPLKQRFLKRLARWAKRYKSMGMSPSIEEYRLSRLLCPLCHASECLIYDSRPMCCRTYINTVDPMQCHPDRKRYYKYPLIEEVGLLEIDLLYPDLWSYRLLPELAYHYSYLDKRAKVKIKRPKLPPGLKRTSMEIMKGISRGDI